MKDNQSKRANVEHPVCEFTATELAENRMRDIGFTDRHPPIWYFSASVGRETTFSLTIRKGTGIFKIDVIDEEFGQPYDYQWILSQQGSANKFAEAVKVKVIENMIKLQDEGIISGYAPDMYI